MRSIGVFEWGGPEVLQVVDLAVPEPGDEEVRVRVSAATVNPADVALRLGALADRLTGPAPFVPGLEFAGVVDAVGEGGRWNVGDIVLGSLSITPTGRGAQSELVVVHSDSVARSPDGIDPARAATLAMNGLTVRRALDMLALAPGQTLCVTGAAGAVGGYAVEMAVDDEIQVLAVAGSDDEALVRSMGASAFVRRGPDAAAEVRRLFPNGVDGMLDAAVIGAPIIPAVRSGGRFIELRVSDATPERGIFVERVNYRDYLRRADKLKCLVALVDAGRLSLRVAHTMPLEHVADAHRRLEAGGLRGRVVLVL